MSEEDPRKKLSEEDLERVNAYLSSPIHQVERKPFRPWLLLFWLWVVVTLLGGVSWLFGRMVGLI
ncbi:MAG: dethiobiotin synthetase [Porticoccaceae bacterium]|nr:dethiobiotin synthetase [Porticoccaceae bacterium]